MRYAIGIEYDGSGFLGWQIQRQEPTVQGVLERALSKVADQPVRVIASGRTDAGVHAMCQVAHFDTSAERSERSWVLGLNSHLPAGASVLWARQVDDDFHARFSAFARSYRYRILNRWVRPALEHGRASWIRQALDADRMNEAAQVLLGEHDFSSFRAANCQATHPVREIQSISVERQGDFVVLDVTANAFLYHMVRNIAGSLVKVGIGEAEPGWLAELLEARDRTLAAPTAPPEGLCFIGARFPRHYALPEGATAFPRGEGLS